MGFRKKPATELTSGLSPLGVGGEETDEESHQCYFVNAICPCYDFMSFTNHNRKLDDHNSVPLATPPTPGHREPRETETDQQRRARLGHERDDAPGRESDRSVLIGIRADSY